MSIAHKPKKILLITDPTRDVDDVVLFAMLAHLQYLGLVEVVGVVVTYMVPELRARVMRLLCKLYGLNHQMVGLGSEYPLGQEGEQELLHTYLEEHRLYGVHYEGLGLDMLDRRGFAIFRDPREVILNAIQDHKDDLYVFVVAPATDLAKAMLMNMGVFTRGGIKGGYWQAGALLDSSGHLVPDPSSFNMSVDMWAAQMVLEKTQALFPWTFVGKHAAYQMPMREDDFASFRDTDHPVGRYLYEAAKNGLMTFALREPAVYSRLYAQGKDVDRGDPIKDATHWSNPYDPCTILALLYPEMFTWTDLGNEHRLIGMTKDTPGVNDPAQVKQMVLAMVHGSFGHWSLEARAA